MNFLATITEKAFRFAGATEVRDYAAAQHGRLVGDWTTQNNSANQEIRSSIRQLRARGRQLARDNDWFIGFLKKLVANVLGPVGMKLQADVTMADGQTKNEQLNRKVEQAWQAWSRKKNCDVTEQSSLRDLAELALRTVVTDGEFLFRYVNIAGQLKIQMLDVDWLDEDYNDPNYKNTGNRIIMSIEVDQYDRPVAYHFTNPKWSNVQIPGMKLIPQHVQRLRIPADQVCHRFFKRRVGQSRGITEAHGAMLTLNQLDGFDEAELVGQRIAASNMAFISPPTDEGGSSLGKVTKPIENEVAPGQILELPAGFTVHEFTPKQPTDVSFPKRMLRKVASSFGINYNTMTSDLEGVNFSSIRAGTVEEREVWKLYQEFMAQHFYQDIYEVWLMFNSNLVPTTKLDQVMYPIWRARGFEWVDPSKDINADIAAVNRGFKTMTEVLGERGLDFEETMAQHAAEKKLIEKLGLQFASPDLQAQLAADQADAAQNNADAADKPSSSKAKAGK
jgi:lambda family phage portal protein